MARDRLTLEQEQFLSVRPTTRTDSEAARAVGLNPRTPTEWRRRSPLFKERYDNLGEDVRNATVQRIQDLFVPATQALQECLQSKNDRTRLKAAEMILSYGGMLKGGKVDINVTESTIKLQKELLRLRDDVIDGDFEEIEKPSEEG